MGLFSSVAGPVLYKAKRRPAHVGAPVNEGQAFDHDPMEALAWQMYQEASTGRGLPFENRERMASAPQIAPMISLRMSQLGRFGRPQPDRYSMGFGLRMRDKRKTPSKAARAKMADMERRIETCGPVDYSPTAAFERDNFRTFLGKVGRDSLIHDAMCIEFIDSELEKNPRTGDPLPSVFKAIDAKTVRRVEPGENGRFMGRKTPVAFIQWLRDAERARWDSIHLAYGVRRPRSDVRVNGYGFPELDELVIVVHGLLNSLDYNMNYFKQGSTTKGILKIIGNIPAKQLRAFRRMWAMMMAGIANAWRTPIINVPGGNGGDVGWVPMHQSNRDMEWSLFNEFLMWIACQHFGIDPQELGLPKYSGGASSKPLFETDNSAALRMSRERGLLPLLWTIEDKLNLHYVWRIDPDFSFGFRGIDEKSERERVELDSKRVKVSATINEVRAENDDDPIEGGDIVDSQTYVMNLQNTRDAAGQGGGDEEPGRERGDEPGEGGKTDTAGRQDAEPADDEGDEGAFDFGNLYQLPSAKERAAG